MMMIKSLYIAVLTFILGLLGKPTPLDTDVAWTRERLNREMLRGSLIEDERPRINLILQSEDFGVLKAPKEGEG